MDCSFDSQITCFGGSNCEKCPTFTGRFSKIVLCNNDHCLYYIKLPKPMEMYRGKIWKPLGEDDKGFTGICDRKNIGIRQRVVKARDIIYDIPECEAFSNKGFKGHMDWSKLQQGGHIDDDYADKLYKKGKVKRI